MSKALKGKHVLVTRAGSQNKDIIRQLTARGAIPVELPAIQLAPAGDLAPLDAALDRLASYHWLIFTSANGVDFFHRRFLEKRKKTAELHNIRIAAIGPATATALAKYGLRTEFIPGQHIAEALAATLPDLSGRRVLLPAANIARPALAEGLRIRGAIVDQVTVYQTQAAKAPPNLAEKLISVDILTFTSSSTVRNFMAMLETDQITHLIDKVDVACIGPKTAQTAHNLGLTVDIIAAKHTVPGLVEALITYYDRKYDRKEEQ